MNLYYLSSSWYYMDIIIDYLVVCIYRSENTSLSYGWKKNEEKQKNVPFKIVLNVYFFTSFDYRGKFIRSDPSN